MNIYIYIDDIRTNDTFFKRHFNSTWKVEVCRSYQETIDILNAHLSDNIIIDLDHDLSEELTGYDICKYIVANNVPIAAFHIHSMNSVGAQNMRELLTHYGYKEI